MPAFVEHGLWFALATAARDGLSDTVATCMCLQAAMKQRSAQAIVLYAMDLEPHLGRELPIEDAREAFLHEPAWQPARRYLERLAATPDWAEVVFAANLCFEPTVATLIRRELGTRAAAANGDTVTPVLARAETQEWEWARAWTVALSQFLLADAVHGEHNRAVLNRLGRATGCRRRSRPRRRWPRSASRSESTPNAPAERMRAYAGEMLAEAGLPELCELVGHEPTAPPDGRPRPVGSRGPGLRGGARHLGPSGARHRPPPGPRPLPRAWLASQPATRRRALDGSYDYVGIVMAKSAEGDAVARFLARRDGIEVIEQPSFWDIRASRASGDPLCRGHRGGRLRDRRVLDPARDVDTLRAHGRHRRRPDAVLRPHRGDGAPAVVKPAGTSVAGCWPAPAVAWPGWTAAAPSTGSSCG